MTQTFHCTACGGPNELIPGFNRMTCNYCGANLTIPEDMRIAAKPSAEIKPPKARPAPSLEKDAPELLRKAQPFAIKAWNAYAYWSWLRWLAPTCLTILVIGFFGCLALGAIPFVLRLIQ